MTTLALTIEKQAGSFRRLSVNGWLRDSWQG
jgi:hypothetical protein